MRKLITSLVLAAVVALPVAALAQDPGPQGGSTKPAETTKRRLNRAEQEKLQKEIFAKIKLTDDQKAKFKAHDEEYKKKLSEFRGKRKNLTEADKEKLKELRKERQKFLKDTLTKEQFQEFMKLRRAEMKKRDDK